MDVAVHTPLPGERQAARPKPSVTPAPVY
ncbi:hypothetical protein WJX75_002532 [Coccomyxa subellipsoidea]|uniref:Uncharacterized protein n=1 Tax=Coccomyxa subellipsoidea TaxID=248742 RepID=A0ABR2Z025_9CHLO